MSETMDSGPDTESGPLLPGQSPMQTQQTQAPRRVTARKTARNTARDLQARQVTQDRRRSPRTVVVDDDDDDGDGKDDDDDDDDDGDDEDSNLDNHGDDAVIVEDDSAAVDESGRTSSASASASATASTAANTTEHRDHIAFIPHHDTVTCAGEDQYGDTTLCKDSICALAEFVDNSLTAVRKMKQKQIEIIVMREGDEPILAIVDSGTGMDKPDIQAFARYHYTTSHRRPDVTNEYPNPRVQFHHHYLNSGISHFGVGAKQAGFYLGNTLDVYTHTADSDTTLYFSMSKAEFDRLSESDENPFQGDVVSKPPVKSTLPKPVAEASALLDDIDTNKSKSYTCVVIRGLNANTLDVLSNMPRVAEELVNIYHYYIHGIPGNVPSDEMGKLSHPSYEHARKAMVPIEMTLCDVKPTPTSVDVHRLDLTTVQGDYETRCLRSAADFFNFSLTCERTVQRRKVKYEFEHAWDDTR
ncbi:hypothetical protein PTSG_08499 [Salpingoeca rosetta]|uniref:Histidine kinase/HSP90-like ATPase domain-containing protein n=1 Tax=Salpingoeca rosetta (strain ATCC 50818 / BSB-021) TaxID=946362 RepID=F2UJV4_SALR5|nr:uncharacterized protein PTSG_08499 [Salpingoeca rosetta]EGD77403.1 hypothetical protein PTSG_08499 [Salpingoeca rosetta]|eukprot:XP_004990747.1 hypothetical protein PTSG_08499 [Salpingoeca rosetta]